MNRSPVSAGRDLCYNACHSIRLSSRADRPAWLRHHEKYKTWLRAGKCPLDMKHKENGSAGDSGKLINKLKNQTHGKKMLLLIPAAMVLLLLGCVILLAPSFRFVDRSSYYAASDSQHAKVYENGAVSDVEAYLQDGRAYLPHSFVVSEISTRFYADLETEGILYCLPDATYSIREGETVIRKSGTVMEGLSYAPVLEVDGEYYLELEFLCSYAEVDAVLVSDNSPDSQSDSNPSRVILWTGDRASKEQLTTAEKQIVRERPSFLSGRVAEVEADTGFTVLGRSGSYYEVLSDDGEYGYLKMKNDQVIETVTRSFTYTEPVYVGTPVDTDGTFTLGFHYVDDPVLGLESLNNRLLEIQPEKNNSLYAIAPSCFTLDGNDGSYRNVMTSEYMKAAHDAGLAVWLMLDNINLESDAKTVFSSKEIRQSLISSLISDTTAFGAEGICLDIESVGREAAPDYVQFIRELSIACRASNLTLSVCDVAPFTYNLYYDYAEQATFADYVILMAYDEAWQEPGPNASLNWVSSVLNAADGLIPKSKLIAGACFETRRWKTNEDGSYSRKLLTMRECEALLPTLENAEWDEESGCYVAEMELDGEVWTLWLEESRSMQVRLERIRTYEPAGISFWCLGQETEDFWSNTGK